MTETKMLTKCNLQCTKCVVSTKKCVNQKPYAMPPWEAGLYCSKDSTFGQCLQIYSNGCPRIVAKVFCETSDGSDDWEWEKQRREANARLIAAAPEMLRLLEELLFVCEGSQIDKALNPDYGVDIDELKAVIAKVKGETK